MALHPLAAQFAAVAVAYERGRPNYAPAVGGALAAELGLRTGGPVLDLAAGTGKLSRSRVRRQPRPATREDEAALPTQVTSGSAWWAG